MIIIKCLISVNITDLRGMGEWENVKKKVE